MASQTLLLTPQIYQYMLSTSLREPGILAELRRETAKLDTSFMQISPEQGQFMALLVQLLGAYKTLDIGVYTGYSSLAVALALPNDGKVVACDTSKEWTNVAKKFWQKAGVRDKIELHLGPALDTLESLLDAGEASTFDFVFIDADKAHYDDYYERSLTLIRPGGLVVVDNVLWDGKVADETIHDERTKYIREFNSHILADERVNISLVPIGDGLMLACKK